MLTEGSTEHPFLSIVVPVYGSPESVALLGQRVADTCSGAALSYELIFVDDRCPKNSWLEIKKVASANCHVVGIRLSRNFGQHAAIQAGLKAARGEWIVVMDCDLQDRPEEIPALLSKANEGFEVVRASRVDRKDSSHRRFASWLFYGVLSYLTDTHQSPEIANFGIYHRKVVNVITQWDEESKYFPAIVSWVGFSQTSIQVEHDFRFSGRSSYTVGKLIGLGLNVIVGFSDKPLKLVMLVGFVLALLSFGVTFAVFVLHLVGYIYVEGWTSIALSLWFLAGSLMFSLGLTGLYVGRVLVESKGRPNFIIDQAVNLSARQVTLARGIATDHFAQ